MVQRAGVFKFVRYVGVFCAIAMGFFSIVATSEDDVEDALNLNFDKDFDLTVDEISVSKPGQLAVEGCQFGLTTNAGIDNLEDEDLLDVDIDKVTLRELQARYRDTAWEPQSEDFSCEVSLSELGGDGSHDILIEDIPIDARDAVDGWSEWITITPADASAINYYLQNRDVAFDLCVECDDNEGAITSFKATIQVNFKVNIEGSL